RVVGDEHLAGAELCRLLGRGLGAAAHDEDVVAAAELAGGLTGKGDGRVGGLSELALSDLCNNQYVTHRVLLQMTLASFFSLLTSSSTSATFTPAFRSGGGR